MVRNRLLARGFAVLTTVTLAPLSAAAQGKASPPARTPDGKPNLAGIFSFSTVTPLQRPDALAGKATLTDEEAAAFEADENKRLNRDLFDPEKGQPSAGYAPRAQGGVLSYNEFWYERGSTLTEDRRTSLIFDPPSGRIPLTEAAALRVASMRRLSDSGAGDSYADRPLADRCRISATLRRAASVNGILPSGSTMSDVRLSRVSLLPRSYQNSLYDSTPPWARGK